MAKPKFEPTGMVRPDTVFHLCSRFDGEWYATITARSDVKGADPVVAIAGPFADLEEAKAHNGKCMELSRRNRQRRSRQRRGDISPTTYCVAGDKATLGGCGHGEVATT
jgi:hypothetical protein